MALSVNVGKIVYVLSASGDARTIISQAGADKYTIYVVNDFIYLGLENSLHSRKSLKFFQLIKSD